MKKLVLVLCVLAMLFTMSNIAAAAFIEVNSGSYYGYYGWGLGTGRAQGFLANETFSVSAVGIYGDLAAGSYQVVVYGSPDGHSAGSVLATYTAASGGTGQGWNDINTSFTFQKDNFYVVNWRLASGAEMSNALAYYNDSALPKTIGPLTLLEGFDGANAEDAANYLHPNLRYNLSAVPIPPSLLLLAPGLLGLGVFRKRFTK